MAQSHLRIIAELIALVKSMILFPCGRFRAFFFPVQGSPGFALFPYTRGKPLRRADIFCALTPKSHDDLQHNQSLTEAFNPDPLSYCLSTALQWLHRTWVPGKHIKWICSSNVVRVYHYEDKGFHRGFFRVECPCMVQPNLWIIWTLVSPQLYFLAEG